MVGGAGGGEEGVGGGEDGTGNRGAGGKTETEEAPKKYLYIGETCRSAYERGLEHINDIKLLKPSSHMLKHLIDKHEHENFDNIEFRMEILSYSRTAYERQIMEAVEIQHHRESCHLLNSRAEFNRSAIPRLGLKLGEKEYKEMRVEEKEEEEKEDTIMAKIKELKKRRNKERGDMRRKEFRNRVKEPENKRRKIEVGDSQAKEQELMVDSIEKRKGDEKEKEGPKRKQMKLDKYLIDTRERIEDTGEEHAESAHPREKVGASVSEAEEYPRLNINKDLIYDWAGRFEEHKRLVEEERRAREDKLKRAEKLKTCWELARLCKEIIQESSNTWRAEKKERKELVEEKRRVEEMKRRAMIKKIAEKRKQVEKTLDKIPQMERKRQNEIEQRERKLEMKEMKSNLWKWRGKEQRAEFDRTNREDEMSRLDNKLKRAELVLEKVRREKEQRLERAEEKSRKAKQKGEEKRQRLAKKERLESSWKTLKWATEMLEDSYDAWETGEEITPTKSSIREWESRNEGEKKEEMSRMYSQASLDAFPTQGRLIKKRILPAWMKPNDENNHLIRHASHQPHVQDHQSIIDVPHVPHEQGHQPHLDVPQDKPGHPGQEQPPHEQGHQPHLQDHQPILDIHHVPHEQGHPPHLDVPGHTEPPNQDLQTEMSRPGKCKEQPESAPEQSSPALMRVLGEQPCPEQQPSTEQCTPHIRQSSTIPLAVLRYDTVPDTNFLMHKLIPNIIHPGVCKQDPRPEQLCGQEHQPNHEEDHLSLSQEQGPKHQHPLDKPEEHGQHPHQAQQNVAAPTPSPDQPKLTENKPNLPKPETASPEHTPRPPPTMQAEQEQKKLPPKQIPAAHPPLLSPDLPIRVQQNQ